MDSKQISVGKKATVLSKVQVRRSLRSLSFFTTYATASHIILSTSHAQTKENYNINGPPVKNTTSQLGADPPTEARWLIAVLGVLYPGTPSGIVVEDADTQEAPDDIRECLHGLMHTKLSMCMLGLSWGGQVIRCPRITDPCCACKQGSKYGHAITSVDLISNSKFFFFHFYTVSFLFILDRLSILRKYS